MKLTDLFSKTKFLRGASSLLKSGAQSNLRQRLLLAIALVFPGAPQLLKQRFITGTLLGVFGVGALIDLGICAWLSSSSLKVFDLLAAINMPNLFTAFPNLQAFSGETTQVTTQPWFWHLLAGHVLIYVVCAALSFWQQWKGEIRKLGSWEGGKLGRGEERKMGS